MSDNHNNSEAIIKPLGVALKGEEAEQLGKQLNDFVSPFSNLFGIAGDWVSEFRDKRKNTLEKTIRHAEVVASKRKKKLKSPPLKFLLQWANGASLEASDNNEALVNMWAELLVSAGDKFSSGHILFARLLKEMTRAEAELLNKFLWKDRENFRGSRLGHCFEAIDHFDICFDGALNGSLRPRSEDLEHMFDELIWRIERPGIILTSLLMFDANLPFGDAAIFEHDAEELYYGKDSHSAALLQSLGLVSHRKGEIDILNQEQTVSASALCLTATGVSFLKACGVEDDIVDIQTGPEVKVYEKPK